jgi:hypothetical protein
MIARRGWYWPLALVGLLGGCTAAQVERAQSYQDRIAGACSLAMTLAPVAGPVAPYIIGGCATEAGIAKLALDSTSLAWLQGLVAKTRVR